jgi:hypothetical protein
MIHYDFTNCKDCHCQTTAHPFCEQFGCSTLREIREILTGEKG